LAFPDPVGLAEAARSSPSIRAVCAPDPCIAACAPESSSIVCAGAAPGISCPGIEDALIDALWACDTALAAAADAAVELEAAVANFGPAACAFEVPIESRAEPEAAEVRAVFAMLDSPSTPLLPAAASLVPDGLATASACAI
jgi:hypothetical protein